MRQHEYFVYIITNKNRTVLYTGVTNSLERRMWEHKTHAVRGFASRYNCESLVYFETYADVQQAIAREKQIKRWTRARKNDLIAAMNPTWSDLATKKGGLAAAFRII